MDYLMKLADEYAEAVGRYVSNKATLGEVADARTALLVAVSKLTGGKA